MRLSGSKPGRSIKESNVKAFQNEAGEVAVSDVTVDPVAETKLRAAINAFAKQQMAYKWQRMQAGEYITYNGQFKAMKGYHRHFGANSWHLYGCGAVRIFASLANLKQAVADLTARSINK